MKTIITLLLFLSMSFAVQLTAQYASSSENPLLTSKEIKVIERMEGIPPMPFQAPDIKGTSHYLPDYKGNVVVMAFWSTSDDISRRQISSLNHLQKAFADTELRIISLAAEEKDELSSFLKYHQVDYPIIPNAKPLGKMGYADELGDSRIYVVDKKGMIRKVYLAKEEKNLQTFNGLKDIVTKLLKE